MLQVECLKSAGRLSKLRHTTYTLHGPSQTNTPKTRGTRMFGRGKRKSVRTGRFSTLNRNAHSRASSEFVILPAFLLLGHQYWHGQ